MESRERRGRPTQAHTDPQQQPVKFTREYKEYDGSHSIWTYDLNINLYGPIMVEEFYVKGSNENPDETDENIPKTKRKYFNPKNGKLVAYSRYCQIMKELGLID